MDLFIDQSSDKELRPSQASTMRHLDQVILSLLFGLKQAQAEIELRGN